MVTGSTPPIRKSFSHQRTNSSLHLLAKQEPARKMAYYQRHTVDEASDNSLTTRRAALKPCSQRQLKLFKLHSSRSLEIVIYESSMFTWGTSVSSTACVPLPNKAALVHTIFIAIIYSTRGISISITLDSFSSSCATLGPQSAPLLLSSQFLLKINMTDWSTAMLAIFHHMCWHSFCSKKLMLLGEAEGI